MTTTLQDTPGTFGAPGGDGPVWSLLVAQHPSRSLVGVRRVLLPGTSVVVARDGAGLGPGGLDDARLSRQHAKVTAGADGTLFLEDLQSRNGTWVNARPITRTVLDIDDVVRVGSILLVVQRSPIASESVRADDEIGALGWPMLGVLASLRALPPRRAVVVWAEAQTGVPALGAWLGRQGGGLVRAEGFPVTAAPTATVLVGPLRDLHDASLAESIAALQSRVARVMVWVEVAPAEQDAHTLVAAPGFASLDVTSLRMPPLRERVGDLPLLIERALRRHHPTVTGLHHQLMTAMLLAPWPGNLQQLDTFVRDRLRPDGAVVRWHPSHAADLGDAPSDEPAPTVSRLRVSRDGAWFERPEGVRVSLHPRRALMQLLAALAAPTAGTLSTAALLEAGWPGERPLGTSGATRVYVALSTLRKLGLREFLVRDGDGYALGGEGVTIERV